MPRQTEQLNFLTPNPNQGQIIPTALHTEMQQSYLEYAMSVIVGRALPDVRDGLKPVHRRILYAMHELGLVPDRPYRKCARVVGDVLGKYHPHGDQSVYDALVRLVQDFSSRYPLLAGHGNFGSVDNDPPAAMRYTECRLAPIGNEALLENINEAVIDFTDNFDSSQQEPVVLPAQLPLLLLNGASGIAVGMATNIPPHNLREVVDGLIALIDRPDLPDDELFKLIPAPDFPTGGIILDRAGIREAYTTGKGSITIRGVARVEEGSGTGRKKQRQVIIITEMPFQVNKAAWIEKVAELVNANKMDGIADIRDESDRTGMRVVIELKKDANPNVLLDQLYRQTTLQVNFGASLLALRGSLPKQMNLRELLQEFISFREETLTRQYRHELDKAQQRLHLVAGLQLVLDDLDRLITVLRFAADSAAAKLELQTQFSLSETQAEAILAMPLRRLTGMERQSLQAEMQELQQQISRLEGLLGDRRELLKALKKELRNLKKKHGDDRRTRIATVETPQTGSDRTYSEVILEADVEPIDETEPEPNPKARGSRNTNGSRTEKAADRNLNGQEVRKATKKEPKDQSQPLLQPETNGSILPSGFLNIQAPVEDVTIQLTHKGYIKRFDANTRANPDAAFPDDVTTAIYPTRTDCELIVLTSSGKAVPVSVADIPKPQGSKSRGMPLITMLPDATDRIVSHLVWDKNPETTASLVLLTAQAKIKRSPLSEFAGMNTRGLVAAKLKDDDRLCWADVVGFDRQIAIATSAGRILRMLANEEQIPTLGRSAMGNLAIRLRSSESLVGTVALDLEAAPDTELILVTAQGFAKRIRADALRLSPRGSIGSQSFQFLVKNDYLAAIASVNPDSELETVTFLIAQEGDMQARTVQVPLALIPLEVPNTQGSLVFTGEIALARTERVVKVAI
ncbi:DNA topoisomerase (ATP-hydrolyzing) [Tumidithrix helvetica PCC 7403]|uniref:DNA gyrase/topoisomerase IV subunit A n=1 Tax=Tumidithrix helvetica TaxID=3457545 RepID=UPI003C8F80B4